MQNFHWYNEAIWLAKVALSKEEYLEVIIIVNQIIVIIINIIIIIPRFW